jgi:cytochrome P450
VIQSAMAVDAGGPMKSFDDADFFSDGGIAADPYPYYEHLRGKGPVVRLPIHDVVAINGYQEGLAVFRDEENFSAAVGAIGPLPPLPFTPEGDDITDQIERHRHEIPLASMIPTLDVPAHTRLKGLLMGIITPKRLKANETAMGRLADRQIDTFLSQGAVEAFSEFAMPFTGLVLGDLLGIPAEEYSTLHIHRPNLVGQLGEGGVANPANLFTNLETYFAEKIDQRRRAPTGDVTSDLAAIRYEDGALPETGDLAEILAFLFGAGQGTTARLITAALRRLAEDGALQASLREDASLIPNFIEEMLRLEGSTKTDFRLTKRRVRIGDLDVAPGTVVMLMIGAMNRDPRQFEDPAALRLDRTAPREHIAFGRGVHACAGAPLARAEARVSVERLLAHTRAVTIDETQHGPAGDRRYAFNESYLLQGLNALHLKFEPA